MKTLAGTYCVLAGIYVVYSLFTQTGICGWLMEQEFELLGAAYDKLTVLAAFMLVGAPGFALLSYANRKEREAADAAGTPLARREPQAATIRQQLRTLIPLALAPALIAIPVYYYLTWQSRQDQQREVYSLDLNSGAPEMPPDAKFVHLEGALRRGYEYGVTTGRNAGDPTGRTEVYTPFTGEAWDESQPVRFVMYTTTVGKYAPFVTPGLRQLPDGTLAGGFDATLTRNELPTFVRNEYERQGLRLAAPLYVVERTLFYNGRPPDAAASGMYYMIPYFGVGLSLAIALGSGIGLAIRRFRGAA